MAGAAPGPTRLAPVPVPDVPEPSHLIVGGLLVLAYPSALSPAGSRQVTAIDLADGRVRWEVSLSPRHQLVVLDGVGDDVVVTTDPGGEPVSMVLDHADGRTRWRQPGWRWWPGTAACCWRTPRRPAGGARVDPVTGAVRWTATPVQPRSATARGRAARGPRPGHQRRSGRGVRRRHRRASARLPGATRPGRPPPRGPTGRCLLLVDGEPGLMAAYDLGSGRRRWDTRDRSPAAGRTPAATPSASGGPSGPGARSGDRPGALDRDRWVRSSRSAAGCSAVSAGTGRAAGAARRGDRPTRGRAGRVEGGAPVARPPPRSWPSGRPPATGRCWPSWTRPTARHGSGTCCPGGGTPAGTARGCWSAGGNATPSGCGGCRADGAPDGPPPVGRLADGARLSVVGEEAGMRVLVVEDERNLADAIARGLRREGWRSTSRTTATRGHEMAFVTRYDVVVLDRDLPGRARRPDLRRPGRLRRADPGADADRQRHRRRPGRGAAARRRRLPAQAVRLRRAGGPGAGAGPAGHPGRAAGARPSATWCSTRPAGGHPGRRSRST